jgi:hypothetical protein
MSYFLHWSDGRDISAIDDQLLSGARGVEVLEGAVVGESIVIQHRECGTRFQVIVLDVVIPLFGDMESRIAMHQYKNQCIACGKKINGRGVLEFLGTTS